MVLSHVMRGRPRGLLQSSGGRVDRILLASVLLSIRAMCQKRVRRHDSSYCSEFGLLASGPRCFEQIGAIRYLAAFVDTTDQKHQSSMHLYSRLPSNQTRIGR